MLRLDWQPNIVRLNEDRAACGRTYWILADLSGPPCTAEVIRNIVRQINDVTVPKVVRSG